ncbi:MAG: flagellar basal body P-ring formation chaperone FlgA [Desulfovibrionaceae bacterium]|nr:flagellar basal body P-ring formation chaperone FlgA [Desulfovibrionaceae bacterium]
MRTALRDMDACRWARRAHCVALAAMVCLLFWAASVSFAADPGWRIRIRSAACVHGGTVLLGDVADAYGDIPAGLWEDFAKRPLWPAPDRVGRVATMTRHRLEGLLRYYLGDLAKDCVLPAQLAVHRGGEVLLSPEIQRRVVAFLTPKVQALGGEAEFKDFLLPDHVFLSQRGDCLEISLGQELAPGRVPLDIEVRSPDGKTIKRAAGSVFFNLWRAVPCAARTLNRNHALGPDNVTFKRKNLAYWADAWDGKGGPWRLSRPVGAGQVLTRGLLEPMPLVSKGDRVVLVYQGRNVRLSVKALALGDAMLGEKVVVRNLQSKKEVQAVVTSGRTVNAF